MLETPHILYYTPEQAAAHLHLKPCTIYRWLKSGKLPGKRISHKAWRITDRDINTMVAQADKAYRKSEAAKGTVAA